MTRRHVRVYVEGGATGRTADQDFRRGWKKFLGSLHELAREHGYHSLEIVRGKGRGNAYERFSKYHLENPDDLCVLLADAETGVPEGQSVWAVVAQREGDRWARPEWATERHLYLMVPFVETWLLTDSEALKQFFGRSFKPEGLPTTNLEARSKSEVETALKRATRESSKGEYRHGQAHEILERVRPERVQTLVHGRRLFESLGALIRGQSEE